MRIVLQRVTHASVTVQGRLTGKIAAGIMVLAGFSRNDNSQSLKAVVEKIMNMRIFSNAEGRFDHSVADLKGEVLLVPQFTLFADTSRGRRPEFFTALEPVAASKLFEEFIEVFKTISKLKVECGEFGADMKVELLNDGPVTIVFDSEASVQKA